MCFVDGEWHRGLQGLTYFIRLQNHSVGVQGILLKGTLGQCISICRVGFQQRKGHGAVNGVTFTEKGGNAKIWR